MKKPVTFVVVGMAGSGKTTFCHNIYSTIARKYNSINDITSINMDPAVENSKMPLTIDIRDTINYRDIMKKHRFGPNGCINTCLNLFLLDFVMPKEKTKYTIIDTPGQIEAFVWSSFGEALMRMIENPVIIYIIDISICRKKYALFSNLLFAAALKIKFRRPVLMVFNKNDLADIGEIETWIRDFEAFKQALCEDEAEINGAILYFEEFYKDLKIFTISCATGSGLHELYKFVDI